MKPKLFAGLTLAALALMGTVVVGKGEVLLDNQVLTTSTNGSAVRVSSTLDGAVLYLAATNNSGTTPTLDVKVQHSIDCTNWLDLDTLSQCTTGTCIRTTHINETSTHILPCLRAVATLGGTSPNYTVTARFLYGKK